MGHSIATTSIPLVRRFIPGSRKALQFGIYGAIGGALGSVAGEVVPDGPGSFFGTVARVGVWFGIIGACISVILLIGHSCYFKRGLSIRQSAREGALFGFLAGAAAGAIAQGTYRVVGPTEVLRVLCWGIAGGLLGYALSFRIPNLGHQPGLGGGMAGGVIGGCLFILFSFMMGVTVGRFWGVVAIGFFIGLMIMLAEAAFREAWLEISYGPKEIRTVSLGPEPISIGSDPKACSVYACDVPSVAFRYKLDRGRIFCEDIVSGSTIQVTPGDHKVIGNVTVSVRVAGTRAPVAPATPVPSGQARGFSLHLSSGRMIRLAEDTQLSVTDIPGLEANSVDGTVAAVSRNPSDPTILGLKNLSRRPWLVTTVSGERRQLEPDRSIKLAVGTKINFGSVTGGIVDE